jgi:hypothetical protein
LTFVEAGDFTDPESRISALRGRDGSVILGSRAPIAEGGPMADLDNLPWRKPRRCESSACAETATTDEHVYMRNSTEPDTVVRFTHDEWDVFVRDLKDEAAA